MSQNNLWFHSQFVHYKQIYNLDKEECNLTWFIAFFWKEPA